MIESEKDLERKLNSEIKRLGGLSIKLLAAHFIGLPDRLCLLPGGRLFFSEIKTTGRKLRRIQQVVILKLENLGFDVYVIDKTEDVKQIISKYEGAGSS